MRMDMDLRFREIMHGHTMFRNLSLFISGKSVIQICVLITRNMKLFLVIRDTNTFFTQLRYKAVSHSPIIYGISTELGGAVVVVIVVQLTCVISTYHY